MTKHARFFLLPSFILISAALIAGCNDKGEEKAHVGEPQVTVHIVKTAPLEVKTELPGRTNAYRIAEVGNDSNLLIVFYVQIMPDDFVMQLHRF